MPYDWIKTESKSVKELHLWPHQSLAPKGFAIFIGATSIMLMFPLFPLIGSIALWGILPFLVFAVAGVWFALNRSQRNAQILEVLTLSPDKARLIRHNPRGPDQNWQCNIYWAEAQMHDASGPVPHYVTLKGEGREVEIGAFLSEDERLALFDELVRALRR
ncbi:MAG: DUF2244 domain-containing protein [Paracoccaceae bacterium]